MTELQARGLSVIVCIISLYFAVLIASWGLTPFLLGETLFAPLGVISGMIVVGVPP